MSCGLLAGVRHHPAVMDGASDDIALASYAPTNAPSLRSPRFNSRRKSAAWLALSMLFGSVLARVHAANVDIPTADVSASLTNLGLAAGIVCAKCELSFTNGGLFIDLSMAAGGSSLSTFQLKWRGDVTFGFTLALNGAAGGVSTLAAALAASTDVVVAAPAFQLTNVTLGGIALSVSMFVSIAAGLVTSGTVPSSALEATLTGSAAGSLVVGAAYENGAWVTISQQNIQNGDASFNVKSMPVSSFVVQPVLSLQGRIGLWQSTSTGSSGSFLLQPVFAPSLQVVASARSCNTYRSCGTCTASEEGCGWCFASSTCLKDSSLCPRGFSRSPVCSICTTLSSCGDCLALSGACGWCQSGASAACMPGAEAGPSTGLQCSAASWHYWACPAPTASPVPASVSPSRVPSTSPSVNCAGYSTCRSCLAAGTGSTCGWCSGGGGKCLAGALFGPSSPATCNAAQWSFGTAVPCAADSCTTHALCSSCTEQTNCGFCTENDACMSGGVAAPDPATGTCPSVKWVVSPSWCTPRRLGESGAGNNTQKTWSQSPVPPASRAFEPRALAASPSESASTCLARANDGYFNTSVSIAFAAYMGSLTPPTWASPTLAGVLLAPPGAFAAASISAGALSCSSCSGCASDAAAGGNNEPPPSQSAVGGIVGGVFGAIGAVALAGLVYWRCRPKRYPKGRRRTVMASSTVLLGSSSGLASMRAMGVANSDVQVINPVKTAAAAAMSPRAHSVRKLSGASAEIPTAQLRSSPSTPRARSGSSPKKATESKAGPPPPISKAEEDPTEDPGKAIVVVDERTRRPTIVRAPSSRRMDTDNAALGRASPAPGQAGSRGSIGDPQQHAGGRATPPKSPRVSGPPAGTMRVSRSSLVRQPSGGRASMESPPPGTPLRTASPASSLGSPVLAPSQAVLGSPVSRAAGGTAASGIAAANSRASVGPAPLALPGPLVAALPARSAACPPPVPPPQASTQVPPPGERRAP